jgi:repressor LexA
MRSQSAGSRKLLKVLERYITRHGYAPSLRELAGLMHMHSPNTVRYYLASLEGAGLIERDRGIARGIRILEPMGRVEQAAKAASE